MYMDILKIILPIAVGALIGYCTNFIAIKMLFLPRKELHIGKWRVPFTPGVIPKNKPRLASAVGNTVSEKLLTEKDIVDGIKNSGIKQKVVDKITHYVMDSNSSVKEMMICAVSEKDADNIIDKISNILSVKIIDGIKSTDLHAIISDIASNSFSGLLSNPMLSMFLGGNIMDSVCSKIESAVLEYVDTNGQEKITPVVKNEVENLLSKSIKSNVEQLDCSEDSVINLLSNIVDKFIETNISDITRYINIKGIIETKINQMNVKELEDLVMSVMKNELRTIVNLGAVIGAVIGIINIFI